MHCPPRLSRDGVIAITRRSPVSLFQKAQYIAQDSTVAELMDAETLEAIEFGWKQRFWDGRGQMNIAVYMQTWENI